MKVLLFFLFFVLYAGGHLYGQETISLLSSYVRRIDTFNVRYPHEKVYLHFDNTCYFLGDSIWFKAYLVNAAAHQPDDWSRTLYVELLTQEGDIITTKKFKTTDGQCHGALALRDTLKAGYYEVRAYTRWMLNFGDGHEFSRVFPVFNKPKQEGNFERVMLRRNFNVPDFRDKNPNKWIKKDKKVTVDFFPEGGHLVQGLPCRVAFKAVDRDSGDLNITGRLFDKLGNSIAYLGIKHGGMGDFEFVPGGEGGYTAEFDVNGRTWKFALPPVEPQGCIVRVNNRDDEMVNFTVYRSEALKQENLGVTISCRGVVYNTAELLASPAKSILVSFPRKSLPSGVSQITVFNTSGDVLAERLLFVNHRDGLNIGITQDKNSYAPFDKVNLDVHLEDSRNHPVEAVFSLAVRDADKSAASDAADIQTYLLLSSELRGYIHNPGYYFEDDSRERKYALDLLLLTQGWSRYVWKRLAGVEPFKVVQPAEAGISLDGVIQEYSRKFKPLKHTPVSVHLLRDGDFYRDKGVTDEDGNFVFAFDFWGEWDLFLQVKDSVKNKGINCDIRLNRFFGPSLKDLSYYETQVPRKSLASRKSGRVDTTNNGSTSEFSEYDELKMPTDVAQEYALKEVNVKKARPYRPEDEGLEFASVAYYMEPVLDKLKDLGKDNANDLFQFLSQNNPYFYTERPFVDSINMSMDKYKGRTVFYVVNNVDATKVAIPVEELGLDRIKLITIDERYGAVCRYKACGILDYDLVAIHIYTDNNMARQPVGVRKTKIEGYALVKEFYNPRYDKGVLPGEVDYRRTLYWNPNIRTDSLGNARIDFYNNGSCRRMNISAQTVTSSGLIGTTGL